MKHQDWRDNENQKQLERDALVKGGKSHVVAIPMNGAENKLTGSGEKLSEWERLTEETLTPSDDTC